MKTSIEARVWRILNYVSVLIQAGHPLSAYEIANRAGHDPNHGHRYADHLEAHGLITRIFEYGPPPAYRWVPAVRNMNTAKERVGEIGALPMRSGLPFRSPSIEHQERAKLAAKAWPELTHPEGSEESA